MEFLFGFQALGVSISPRHHLIVGFFDEARRIFNEEVKFDVVGWNTMILGVAKCREIGESKSCSIKYLKETE